MHDFADYALAGRLESFAAHDVRGFVEAAASLFPDSGARCLEVAGGVAGYVDAGSPANGAVGLGFDGEVTHGHIASIEEFFLGQGETPVVAVCPLAHPSLARMLSERGWTVGAFENVLFRSLSAEDRFDPQAPSIAIREARSEEDLDAWALMAANGFSAPEQPTQSELRLASVATRRERSWFLFGLLDGAYAGTGQLEIVDDLGWLSGDTTVPRFRRNGVQASLQRSRLEIARDAGCTLAVSESAPGSASQRNMERLGFRVAYTRVDATLPMPIAHQARKGPTS